MHADDDNNDDETPSAIRKVAATAMVKALAPLNYVGEKVIWKKVQEGFGGQLLQVARLYRIV